MVVIATVAVVGVLDVLRAMCDGPEGKSLIVVGGLVTIFPLNEGPVRTHTHMCMYALLFHLPQLDAAYRTTPSINHVLTSLTISPQNKCH